MQRRSLILAGMIVATFVIRLVPYVLNALHLDLPVDALAPLWNFSPMTTVCLLAGTYCATNGTRFGTPLLMWCASNVLMTLLMKNDPQYLVYPGLPFVAGCFLLTGGLGWMLRRQSLAVRLAGGALCAVLSETLFFLITNAAEWAFMGTYPHTWTGLLDCYAMGLPFFRQSLLGTACFFPVLYGGFSMAEHAFPALQLELQPHNA